MSMMLDAALQAFATGALDWTGGTWKVAAMALSDATDTAVRVITGATNATPIVIASAGHAIPDGERIYIGGVQGNEAANGEWVASVVDADHVALVRQGGIDSVGSGAYGSGGYLVLLGNSAGGNAWDDFSGAAVGDEAELVGRTVTDGVLDAADLSAAFVVPMDQRVDALMIFMDTGTASTSIPTILITGTQRVVVAADADAGATLLWVEPLSGDLPSGASLALSNGVVAVTSTSAAAGDRQLAVTALSDAVGAGNQAEGPVANSGIPFTSNGNGTDIVWNNGAVKIARL